MADEDDLKRGRVLEGATRVFLAYGYKRVTMDDIAQASDMSRPALYLLYRNKADIYRAIGEQMFEQAALDMEAVMEADGPLVERMGRAFEGTIIAKMAEITQSPHGAELLDLKNELAAGMLETWRDRTALMMAQAIKRETAATGVDLAARGLSAEGLAAMMLDTLEGMKQRTKDRQALVAGIRQLVRTVDLAIRK